MYCKNCGKELSEGALFCAYCGTRTTPESTEKPVAESIPEEKTPVAETTPVAEKAPVAETISHTAPTQPTKSVYVGPTYQGTTYHGTAFSPETLPESNYSQPNYSTESVTSSDSNSKKKSKKPMVIAAVIAGVVVVGGIVGGSLFIQSRKVVNLNDYVSVEFSGYDTVGAATVTIDDEAWEQIYEKSKLSSKKKSDGASYAKKKLSSDISYSLDQDSALSDGDEVVLTWNIDAEAIKKDYGITIVYEDTTYTVEGLEEVDTFSPFDAIDVSFQGLDGDGTVEITVNDDSEIYNKCKFSASQTSGLSVGDVVTITFDYNGYSYDADSFETYCAENFGMIPTETEKEYTVDALGEYAALCSQLTNGDMTTMKSDAESLIRETEPYWEMDTSLVSLSYSGMYVQSPIDTYTYQGNYVYLMYEITAECESYSSGETEEYTYYTYVVFQDVVVNPDGTISYNDYDYTACSNIFRYDSDTLDDYFQFYGYASLDDFEADEVTPYDSQLTTDSSMGGDTL